MGKKLKVNAAVIRPGSALNRRHDHIHFGSVYLIEIPDRKNKKSVIRFDFVYGLVDQKF